MRIYLVGVGRKFGGEKMMDRLYVNRSISEYNTIEQASTIYEDLVGLYVQSYESSEGIQRLYPLPTRTTVKTIDPIQSNTTTALLLTLF